LSDRIVLGIESAIAGGSISIRKNDAEVGSWIGDQSVSRAEELLPNIDLLLRSRSISLDAIERIIVSLGPGSFTGIKIGLATVLGLRAALGITCVGINALSSLALISTGRLITAAVPIGRGTVCVQAFSEKEAIGKPRLINAVELEQIYAGDGSQLVMHGSLFDADRFPGAMNAGWNIASHLCSAVDSPSVTTDLRPMFVERNLFTAK
jgi:tRNA threonylcarbamoyladenosine biosynthesis protein TsaB